MVERLRRDPTNYGLVTGLGWFSTKHAWGTYGATPPKDGFRWRDAQSEVDAGARVHGSEEDGPITVETYTVTHDREGAVRRLIVAGRRANGTRVWSHSDDTEIASAAESVELIGRAATVRKGMFVLR